MRLAPIALLALLVLISNVNEPVALGEEVVGAPSQALDEVVVTATRGDRDPFDIPTAVTVMGPEALSLETPAVLPGYLRGEAGVFAQQTTPGQASPIVRGLIGSSVLMLVDGMRLNTAIFRPAPNQYYSLVDAWNVEPLEVVRGTASTLYGSDAMGGVVNVVTPLPRLTGADWSLRGTSLGAFRSADLSAIGRLTLEGGRQGIGLRGGLTYEAIDDVRAGGGIGVQRPSGYEVGAGDVSALFKDDVQDLLLSTQYLQQPRTPRYDELVAGFGQTRPSSAVFLFEPNSRLFLHTRYRRRRPAPWIEQAEVHVAYQDIDDDRQTRDLGSTEDVRERNASHLTGVTLQLASIWGPSKGTARASAPRRPTQPALNTRAFRGAGPWSQRGNFTRAAPQAPAAPAPAARRRRPSTARGGSESAGSPPGRRSSPPRPSAPRP